MLDSFEKYWKWQQQRFQSSDLLSGHSLYKSKKNLFIGSYRVPKDTELYVELKNVYFPLKKLHQKTVINEKDTLKNDFRVFFKDKTP